MNNRLVRAVAVIAFGVVILESETVTALDAPKPETNGTLASKAFHKPELRISSSNVPFEQAFDGLSNKDAWLRFAATYGAPQVYIDPRSGAATGVITRVPMIPGRGDGNKLSLTDVSSALGQKVDAIDRKTVADLVRRFATRNAGAIGIDSTQLGTTRAEQVTDQLWHIRIPQVVNGVPVRYGHMVAVINSGNLVLLGTETWGNVNVDTRPKILGDQAMAIGFAHVGGRLGTDQIPQKPNLEILPVAPQEHQLGEGFGGPIGLGYRHRLVWSFHFERKGEDGSWEVIVDAHTGEVVSFQDTNHYAAKEITGGVYPLTSTGVCPANDICGEMYPGYPMPWADTGLVAPNNFTNSAGLFDYTSGTVTTTLNGKYVRINDNCGPISEVGAGSVLLGGVNGQHDCTSAGASPGDTPASRSAFYEVNKLLEQARGWLPGSAYLQQQIRANVNIQNTCNAFYSTLDGTINFYRSGGGCRNTGEIAAVFDHEWGHAFDDNDSGGALSTSSEAYADIAAIYRLQASCVGYGFFQTIDDGCGMTADGTGFNSNESQQAGSFHCNTNCSGVRDADWALHVGATPDTPQNFSCTQCISGSGPCGRQTHCDAAPTRQAAWDLVNRDLTAPPFNMALNDAYIVGNKLFYQGSGIVGSWHACTCPSTSDGCGATNGYMAWLAADDDNGNLADGTPHMTALHAAFARHNLACATPAPTNGGCAGGPTTAPNLNVAVGSNSLNLSWSAVPGASSYRVLRSEGYAGCDFGKAVIANVTGTNYTDPDVANGRTFSYVVQAVGTNSACFGPGSACVQGTPQPCAGAISLGQYLYNCGGAPLDITLVDGDLMGSGTHTVTVSSFTENTAETVSLVETPANSGVFVGTFGTTSAPPVALDGAISVTNGDTIFIRYLDQDFCGTPDVLVTQTATVDCASPIITNVQVTNVTGNSADVTFETNEPTDAVVFYGTPLPTSSTTNANLTTTHTVHISGLEGCTAYVASVQATDPAGNTASDDNAGAYYGFITLVNVFPTFSYTGPPLAITDFSTITASINVTDTRVVQGVKVKIVELTHTYDGDLELFLIGPNNVRVELSTRNGGTGENFINTVFDDAAATAITAGQAPFTGSFRPEGSLATVTGIPANGDWKLEVSDEAGSDSGTLTDWEIELQFAGEQCPTVGRVTLDQASYQCDETMQIHVVDFSIVGAVTLPVTIESATEAAGETVVLNETPADSGSFLGSIPLTVASASTGDGYLSIADGDTVTVTYIDADDGYGGTNLPRTDTAIIDCTGPAISDVAAINVTGRSATITWTTGEPASSEAFYGVGPTPSTPVSSATLVTSHSLQLTGLAPCTTYLFYVRSTDATANVSTDDNSGVYFSFTTLTDNQPVFAYAGAPMAIPDNSVLGVAVPISIADVKEILDVDVKVSVTHPNVGDLEVLLIAPGGAPPVSLSLRRGGTGDNYTNTVFDDSAATSIATGTAPFTGSFKPETALSALNGRLTDGTWNLRVRDRAATNTGTVTAWSLNLTYPMLACDAPYVHEASHSVADSCQGEPANTVVDPGESLTIPYELVNTGNAPVSGVAATISTTTPGITFPDGSASYGALGIGQRAFGDAPFQASVDPSVPCGTLVTFDVNAAANEGAWSDSFSVRVGTAVFGQSTLNSTNTPMPLPDVRTAQLSTIAVVDPGVVGDVNVQMNITHTYDGDLDIFLIGPNGTRVELTTDNGNSVQNFINTVFDDSAALSITQGTAPFTGSFRPEGMLATLNGIPAAGNWTLEITDDANGDSGTLNNWSLILTTPNGYSCTSCGLVAPGEVTQLMFTAKDAVQWSAVSGASDYYLYRGASDDLPELLGSGVDSCERGTTASLSMTGLTEVPAAGDFDWYLVRGWNSAGYGSPGSSSMGARHQDSAGVCP